VTQKPFVPTKPSFLEAGLPCASLSAECQRDNNARQRPPQNRLHIWWARRPPTICRAAILAALLPYDLEIEKDLVYEKTDEPSEADLEKLPKKFQDHEMFFRKLITDVEPTNLTDTHEGFLNVLGILGDPDRAFRRMVLRETYLIGNTPILLPMDWTYRHPPAFCVSPKGPLIEFLHDEIRRSFGLSATDPVVMLDFMAGGSVIPLEGVRYGLKVYANDLNPVASLVSKATIEYPTKYGSGLISVLLHFIKKIDQSVRDRLLPFFYIESPEQWWLSESNRAKEKFMSRNVIHYEPADRDSSMNCCLWTRIVPCPKCNLNIPISTNFNLVKKKGRPDDDLAAFPEVPTQPGKNDCTFRIVNRDQWKDCIWPKPGFEKWHPSSTPTYKGGNAICPRCGGTPITGDEVKAIARKLPGGLSSRMYAVVSKVPVKLTYKNGDVKIRYMWRFRAPNQNDLDAVENARAELDRMLPRWEAQGLVPDEEIPEDMEDKRPRDYGMTRWRHLFTPRQLLTNMVILEEILKAQQLAKKDFPADEAEAIGVYLAFILSKVVSYNTKQNSWDDGRCKIRNAFPGHDYRYHAAFTEIEGSRETVLWSASQIISAYEDLASLIHGQSTIPEPNNPVNPTQVEESIDGDFENQDENENDEYKSDQREQDSLHLTESDYGNRTDIITPTITCEDAAALTVPDPGTVHLICVDPPYYNNVQYAELSNFFYVWLKRSLKDYPGLGHLFREPLAETNREAVANSARWQKEAQADQEAWQKKYDEVFESLRSQKTSMKESREKATLAAGPKPLTAKDRADRFYENKMAGIFRRGRLLLHPAGRMVVMFNHKQTWAWRSLGMALIKSGFEIRSSVPILTEAPQGLNIRGLDAARSTILLLCLPLEQTPQPVGNWAAVKNQVFQTARNVASHFQGQGLSGTDLYLSVLGPALGEVARNWPVTDITGEEVDLADALNEAYRSVAQWRLDHIFEKLAGSTDFQSRTSGFSIQSVDRDTQTLWLWLDTFQGRAAGSDDVQKLGKALNVDPESFQQMGLLDKQKDIFLLQAPQEMDLLKLSLRLKGVGVSRGRQGRQSDVWEERTFDGFFGAAVWNAISLMIGQDNGPVGPDALSRWLNGSGYGHRPEFLGSFAVTLHLLEKAFAKTSPAEPWHQAALQARRAWDLVLKSWRITDWIFPN
jgi:adenine-specific DNA methylase